MRSIAAFALLAAATAAQADVLSYEIAFTLSMPETTHEQTRDGVSETITSSFKRDFDLSLTGSGEVGEQVISATDVVNWSFEEIIIGSYSELFDGNDWEWDYCTLDNADGKLYCAGLVMSWSNGVSSFQRLTYSVAQDYFSNGGVTPQDDADDTLLTAVSGRAAGEDSQQYGAFLFDTWVDLSAWDDNEVTLTHEITLGDDIGTEYTYADLGFETQSPCLDLLEGEAPASQFYSIAFTEFGDSTSGVYDRKYHDITEYAFETYHEVCSGATSLGVSAAAIAIALTAM